MAIDGLVALLSDATLICIASAVKSKLLPSSGTAQRFAFPHISIPHRTARLPPLLPFDLKCVRFLRVPTELSIS